MERLQLDFDPYANDPGHWGASLVNLAELIVGCLETAGARSVVEVGAYAGDLTGLLVDWAGGHGAGVTAVDPRRNPSWSRSPRSGPSWSSSGRRASTRCATSRCPTRRSSTATTTGSPSARSCA